MQRLEGISLPWQVWESGALPARVPGFQRRWLEEQINGGEWTWFLEAGREDAERSVAFCTRAEMSRRPPPLLATPTSLDRQTEQVLDQPSYLGSRDGAAAAIGRANPARPIVVGLAL